ncbi:MAG: discoidin domain-containing protein [Pseudomonadota bacterium]|nr:discoidin domain-containing protein [Pseudomonadota bacterium]
MMTRLIRTVLRTGPLPLAVTLFLLSVEALAMQTLPIDRFETLEGWEITAAQGADAEVAQDEGRDGMAMRLDFDFQGQGGFFIARKPVTMPLPDNYGFTLSVRGSKPVKTLEIKLIGPKSQNVWWAKRQNLEFTGEWEELRFKKRHFDFAWGPDESAGLKEIGAIEIAITAGSPGVGSLWIDDFEFEIRPVSSSVAEPPVVRASTGGEGNEPERVLDGDPETSWRSGSIAEEQWLELDFGDLREYGGLVIDWTGDDFAREYRIETSVDGEQWKPVYAVEENDGGRDYVYLPDSESRYLKILLTRSGKGEGYAVNNLEVKPYAFSSTPNAFIGSIANEMPRGLYPRYFSSEQTYWTVAGIPGDEHEALINEEGMVELREGEFSIEPFIHAGGEFITWNDASLHQRLAGGYLPIPSVTWEHPRLSLEVTALAAGPTGHSGIHLRYRVTNASDAPLPGNLYLALRPLQVNPPWQSLNVSGGVGSIRSVSWFEDAAQINDGALLQSLTPTDGFGATRFIQGDIPDFLAANRLPEKSSIHDTQGSVSAAMRYAFDLQPGESADIFLYFPFYEPDTNALAALRKADPAQNWAETYASVTDFWTSQLNLVELHLPEAGRKFKDVLRSTLAYILINQDGPMIQPGSRDYARAWIRDGALTSTALLQLGHTEPVRRFIRWYAGFQYPSGKIPCCIDRRGADSVPENDSQGQWIYLLYTYYRYTRDVGFLTEMWPTVERAANYIQTLRNQRLTDEFLLEANRKFYGLMPESISHEGYSSNPVHSYWDDFFTLRGLIDAERIATILGYDDKADEYRRVADAFREDLYASISLSIIAHGIDYIPGAAELGDFDATSIAIAVDPLGEMHHLPQPAFGKTFDDYYGIFSRRKDPEQTWVAYTPYELRIAGAFLRMGWKERALEMLDYFLGDQRPPGWNHWAEVAWNDQRAPKFIGDMPHTWVGTEYIRTLRNMFVLERDGDRALVLAAGVPEAWLAKGEHVGIQRFPTEYGTINYTMKRQGDHEVSMRISGDLDAPRAGIIVQSPLAAPLKGATVNGIEVSADNGTSVRVDQFPADITLFYEQASELAHQP